eukprot:3860209-Prymnesium_polylepis.1
MDYKKWAEPHVYESNWAVGKSSVSGIKDGPTSSSPSVHWMAPSRFGTTTSRTRHTPTFTLYPLLRNAAGEP